MTTGPLSPNGASALRPSFELQMKSDGVSNTDEKIYQLIVGKIIPAIAAGLAIVCFIASFVITPLFAIGVIGCFAIALLAVATASADLAVDDLELEEELYLPPPPPFVPNQPVGLQKTRNNCWVISMLQMVLNNPELEAKFAQTQIGSSQPFVEIFTQYRASQAAAHHVCTHDLGAISRSALQRFGVKIDSHFSQEDVADAFSVMLAPPNGPAFYQLQQSVNGRESTFREVDGTINPFLSEPMIGLQIIPNNSFGQMLDLYFSHHSETTGSEDIHVVKKFTTAPQTLVVQLKRFTQRVSANGSTLGAKDNSPCEIPLALTLSADKSADGNPANYECTGLIQHLGTASTSGHYISFIKREGKWWLCNDAYVREVPEADVIAEAKKNAYIISYTKV